MGRRDGADAEHAEERDAGMDAEEEGNTKAKPTQGRRLIAILKRRALTYRQMLQASESVCPWRRVLEALAPHEQIVKGKTREGWTTWRVVAATKWTA